MTDDLEGTETQVGDIEFLIGYAQGLADVDATKIAVAGYSWGGVSNVFAAARDSRIRALIGFDGGIRFVGKLVAAAKYMEPKRIAVPFLYLQSPMPTHAEIAERHMDDSDDFLLRLRYADVYVMTFPQVVHYHFASEHLRFLDTSEKVVFPGDHSLAEISRAYAAMARYVLEFLDAQFKGDAAAGAALKKPPAGMRSVDVAVRPADGVPPTRDAFAAELARGGFADAAAVYAEFRAKDSTFALTPFEFMTWIGTLQERKRLGEAIEIGKLFVKIDPDKPGAYVWLGDSQLMQGDRASALENYRKAQQIDPANAWLAKRLQQIEAGAEK
jgi:dienelactone hydrolase